MHRCSNVHMCNIRTFMCQCTYVCAMCNAAHADVYICTYMYMYTCVTHVYTSIVFSLNWIMFAILFKHMP